MRFGFTTLVEVMVTTAQNFKFTMKIDNDQPEKVMATGPFMEQSYFRIISIFS